MYKSVVKRVLDFLLALAGTIVLSPLLLVLAAWVKLDSKGPVFFRQKRVGRDKRLFSILKFRSMYADTPHDVPTHLLQNPEAMITRSGRFLRRTSLDELPQLLNVLKGEMSFVGTRPEVEKYVDQYSEEMMATLFLPAGITSYASIMYKDEDERIGAYQKQTGKSVDEIYREYILPEKMKYNLKYLKEFSIWRDMKLMLMTVAAVLK